LVTDNRELSVNSVSLSRGRFSGIYDPGIQAIMYAFLLVATPFILLRNYLVQAIAHLSDKSIPLFGIEIKVVPSFAVLIALVLFLAIRKKLNRMTFLAVILVMILDTIAQQITDYYFGHKFYDLQQNWHYIAYGIYSFMVYRALEYRKIPLHKIMLITYFSALVFSTFDEFFQMFMSARVFDICDIGKDVWGVKMGMILVYFAGRQSQAFFKEWKTIRHPAIRQYFRHPFTLLLMMLVLSFIFLNVGSLLTEAQYAPAVVLITLAVFFAVFTAWHISQYKVGKIILLGVAVAAIISLSISYFKYRNDNIVYNSYGLTVYKGIPIPFFDIMIYPDGTFRLVDKKHYFNQRDRDVLMKQKSDIILMGSGADGIGGKGFPDPQQVFLFNVWAGKAVQIIIQKTPDAAVIYNQLKKENKSVLFVIHNTC
jgi:VanZ family protein